MAPADLLRGFVGQNMGGRKAFAGARLETLLTIDSTSAGSVTAPRRCIALVYAWGGGGSGGDFNGGGFSAGGGGGGAALFKAVRLGRGQVLSWAVGAGGLAALSTGSGNPGGDTTIFANGGLVATAGGGGAGLRAVTPNGVPGAAGVAIGGDVNRKGGAGGGDGLPGGSGGVGGAAGGAGATSAGGGGGAAGFTDIGPELLGGAGGNGSLNGLSAASNFGGGSGASGGGWAPGVGGHIIVRLMRVY